MNLKNILCFSIVLFYAFDVCHSSNFQRAHLKKHHHYRQKSSDHQTSDPALHTNHTKSGKRSTINEYDTTVPESELNLPDTLKYKTHGKTNRMKNIPDHYDGITDVSSEAELVSFAENRSKAFLRDSKYPKKKEDAEFSDNASELPEDVITTYSTSEDVFKGGAGYELHKNPDQSDIEGNIRTAESVSSNGDSISSEEKEPISDKPSQKIKKNGKYNQQDTNYEVPFKSISRLSIRVTEGKKELEAVSHKNHSINNKRGDLKHELQKKSSKPKFTPKYARVHTPKDTLLLPKRFQNINKWQSARSDGDYNEMSSTDGPKNMKPLKKAKNTSNQNPVEKEQIEKSVLSPQKDDQSHKTKSFQGIRNDIGDNERAPHSHGTAKSITFREHKRMPQNRYAINNKKEPLHRQNAHTMSPSMNSEEIPTIKNFYNIFNNKINLYNVVVPKYTPAAEEFGSKDVSGDEPAEKQMMDGINSAISSVFTNKDLVKSAKRKSRPEKYLTGSFNNSFFSDSDTASSQEFSTEESSEENPKSTSMRDQKFGDRKRNPNIHNNKYLFNKGKENLHRNTVMDNGQETMNNAQELYATAITNKPIKYSTRRKTNSFSGNFIKQPKSFPADDDKYVRKTHHKKFSKNAKKKPLYMKHSKYDHNEIKNSNHKILTTSSHMAFTSVTTHKSIHGLVRKHSKGVSKVRSSYSFRRSDAPLSPVPVNNRNYESNYENNNNTETTLEYSPGKRSTGSPSGKMLVRDHLKERSGKREELEDGSLELFTETTSSSTTVEDASELYEEVNSTILSTELEENDSNTESYAAVARRDGDSLKNSSHLQLLKKSTSNGTIEGLINGNNKTFSSSTSSAPTNKQIWSMSRDVFNDYLDGHADTTASESDINPSGEQTYENPNYFKQKREKSEKLKQLIELLINRNEELSRDSRSSEILDYRRRRLLSAIDINAPEAPTNQSEEVSGSSDTEISGHSRKRRDEMHINATNENNIAFPEVNVRLSGIMIFVILTFVVFFVLSKLPGSGLTTKISV